MQIHFLKADSINTSFIITNVLFLRHKKLCFISLLFITLKRERQLPRRHALTPPVQLTLFVEGQCIHDTTKTATEGDTDTLNGISSLDIKWSNGLIKRLAMYLNK